MAAIAVALFTRFSLDDTLRRDEAIYTYGGQQLVHGVPFYVSIFDPKTPLAGMLAGLGALWAKVFGVDDVHSIRVLFFAFACLAVVAVYLLGNALWRSPLAGLVSAVAFASFKGFALDALGGPDAKTPGIFLGVLAMVLLVRRRWFWGAFAGSLAFLVWQPLVVYAAVAVLAAAIAIAPAPGERRRNVARAVAGAAIPVAAMIVYYALAGALPQFFEAAIRFPLTGIVRGHETLGQRLDFIALTVDGYYGRTRFLFWGGLVLLLVTLVARLVRRRSGLWAVVKDPYVSIVILTFVALAVFSARDFQGYPDLYPLLPYAALGWGEAVTLARGWIARLGGGLWRRRAGAAVALAAVAGLVALTWVWYSIPAPRDRGLVTQRGWATQLERLLGPRGNLYALGDPTPLVLTGRRNPSRYIYLGSGVAKWGVEHTPGRFAGWTGRIRAAHPAVVVLEGWKLNGLYAQETERWLRARYSARYLGHWRVFVRHGLAARAASRGVVLTRTPRA